jgi:hypothetical protein
MRSDAQNILNLQPVKILLDQAATHYLKITAAFLSLK